MENSRKPGLETRGGQVATPVALEGRARTPPMGEARGLSNARWSSPRGPAALRLTRRRCASGVVPAVRIPRVPGRRAKVEGDHVRTAAPRVRERTWLCPRRPQPAARPSPPRRASGTSRGSGPTRGKGPGPPASFRSGSGKGKNAHRLHSLEPNCRHLGPAPEAEARSKLVNKSKPAPGRRGLRVREGVGGGRWPAGRRGSSPR